jgi:ATP-dependent helicase/nuclease subunit A
MRSRRNSSRQSEAEGRWRTLFMVGDYKQAIYSFQGTDPKEFEAFRAESRLVPLRCWNRG